MGDAGFFKGTSAEQDSRFSNKEKKLLKSMSFPPELIVGYGSVRNCLLPPPDLDLDLGLDLRHQVPPVRAARVDIKKVNLAVMKPWITNRVTSILGMEDEVVIDFVFSLLEQDDLDAKSMQINLTGFLESKTQGFVLELWKLLLSAQDSIGGIPGEFLEQKKEELRRKKAEEEMIMEQIRERKEKELRDREDLDRTREREKRERKVAREDRDRRDRARRSPDHRPRRNRSGSRDRRREERNKSPPKYRLERSPSRERRRDRRSGRRRSRSRSYSPSDRSSRKHRESSPRRAAREDQSDTRQSRWDQEN
ncbi:PWI domain-containing protein [Basidiobolus meristosporus CBS 931.73]|uniref:PWI domain-containing protein n=1 Tax=Basidiobolus meristosporus CBS 931.73 TaxID=1314790 RepID=A0A1Y1XTJ7_9FUNG|nr:PWI domain-containing protein [Basidiobolus meristosporus CBS 931.73]|eukprot:ORX89033.1 PWI domain-containing protein [Basidiobolus meristosporus CBS 931.73]